MAHSSPNLKSQILNLKSDRNVFSDENEYRRLGHHQIALFLEGDFYRRLPEEDGVVSDPGLHRAPARLAVSHFPGLIVADAHVGNWIPRAYRDHQSGLHLHGIHRRRRQVEAGPHPVLTLFGSDEDPVAYQEQLLLGEFHRPIGSGQGPTPVSNSTTRSARIPRG